MMKVLILLSLAAVALTDSSDYKMIQNWQKMKAMESCWGEENMKLFTVNTKKAIAKCSGQDAPELSLPPYSSTYRFVNVMINSAESMDSLQFDMLEMMVRMLKDSRRSYGDRQDYRPDSRYSEDSSRNSDSWMEKMKVKFFMKQMMENMMEQKQESRSTPLLRTNQDSNYKMNPMKELFSEMMDKMDNFDFRHKERDSYTKNEPMPGMSQFIDMFSKNLRSKRSAGQRAERVEVVNSLDLGDRLVEKLNVQKREMEQKIGNMTCVLKEMKVLNSNNEIDIPAIKQDIKQYSMPSEWFKNRYEEIIDMCYEMATNLPANIEENSEISGDFGSINLAQIKSFSKCCMKNKSTLCMNQDIKKKIEANFGPLEEILEQTQLTEYQIFPLVIQLLHGEEMEFMGDF